MTLNFSWLYVSQVLNLLFVPKNYETLKYSRHYAKFARKLLLNQIRVPFGICYSWPLMLASSLPPRLKSRAHASPESTSGGKEDKMYPKPACTVELGFSWSRKTFEVPQSITSTHLTVRKWELRNASESGGAWTRHTWPRDLLAFVKFLFCTSVSSFVK